jgi:nitrogen-specific signal transduction histidine kinase
MAEAGENIFIIDPQFVIRKTSLRLRSKLGLEHDKQLVGHVCHHLFYNSAVPCENCPVSRSIACQSPVEERLPGASHSKYPLKATPVVDDQGRVASIIVDCLQDSMVLPDLNPKPFSAAAPSVNTFPSQEENTAQFPAQNLFRVVLVDNELNIILMSKTAQTLLRSSLKTGIGENLFAALPHYSQSVVREQIERFIAEENEEKISFNARADYYSEEWIEHTLVKLSMRGRTGAILIISSPQAHAAEQDKSRFHKEKLKMLSQFSGKISHEIKNHLALISTNMEFLKNDMISVNSIDGMFKLFDYIDQVQEKISQLVGILETLDAIKPHRPNSIAEIDVGQLTSRSVTMALLNKPFPGNEITVTLGQDLPFLYGVELSLERALIELLRSLLVNAGSKGVLNVSCNFIHDKKGQFVLKIRVNSAVASETDMEALLNDFISPKGQLDKSKIGLITAYATILNHDGSMELFKINAEETEVLVKLPRMTKF